MGVIHKFRGEKGSFTWEGVSTKKYPNDRAKNVTRQVMVGPKEGAKKFEMRYFEMAPGGYTSLDIHKHDHAVLILRGQGRVLLGEKTYEIGFGDAIYISQNERHQFENTGDGPLGFICVIPPKE
ncbi:MAG: cupin domain-containing protein [bacterium]